MLRIAILGCRGIPNRYGGFEQLAEHLSVGLAKKGHEVYVYNSHKHPYQESDWHGVNIIHCYDPEYRIGMAGQFIYDLNCTIDARKRGFDVLLVLGYTSSSIWGWLYSSKTVCINHMDGLEWTRKKYGWVVRQFLKFAECLAVKFADAYIADSQVVKAYLAEKYKIHSTYIAYGADILNSKEQEKLQQPQHGFALNSYCLLIARMEKENNIEMILDGMHLSHSDMTFVVVGNVSNAFGRYLVNKYQSDRRIRFLGSIYNSSETAMLKINCSLYFHGHSVGGTNPSLLEAMAAGIPVCAHANPYNREVLGEDGYYFSSPEEVSQLILMKDPGQASANKITGALEVIKHRYNWKDIIDNYERMIESNYKARKHDETIVYTGYTR